MTLPVNIRSGWIQVTISHQKRFDNPDTNVGHHEK